jgi:uncharacterized integral membrane protein
VAFFLHPVTIFPVKSNFLPSGEMPWQHGSGRMVKRIAVLVLFLIILVIMIVFTRLNPGLVEIDLAFGTVQSSIPLAFTTTFVMGWLFGSGFWHSSVVYSACVHDDIRNGMVVRLIVHGHLRCPAYQRTAAIAQSTALVGIRNPKSEKPATF